MLSTGVMATNPDFCGTRRIHGHARLPVQHHQNSGYGRREEEA